MRNARHLILLYLWFWFSPDYCVWECACAYYTEHASLTVNMLFFTLCHYSQLDRIFPEIMQQNIKCKLTQ